MKKKLFIFFVLIIFCLALSADDKDDAKKLIKDTVDKVQILLKNNDIEPDTKLTKIMDLINPVFDFSLMAKLTLGRKYWPKLDAKQKNEFVNLFVTQLQDSYYEMLQKYSDEKVLYKDPVQKKNKINITLIIQSKDDEIKILYKIYKKKGEFKIYDIEIQEVSIVKSYSSQYRQILDDGTVDELLKKMREKSKEQKIEEKEEEEENEK